MSFSNLAARGQDAIQTMGTMQAMHKGQTNPTPTSSDPSSTKQQSPSFGDTLLRIAESRYPIMGGMVGSLLPEQQQQNMEPQPLPSFGDKAKGLATILKFFA